MAKKILVVDDELGSVLLFESVLKKRGYAVSTATNGEDAIEKARKEKPDLILLDIIMPRLDGTEVAIALRGDPLTSHIPVFFITALIGPGDKINIAGTATNLVFAKPVNLNELLAKIQEQIGS